VEDLHNIGQGSNLQSQQIIDFISKIFEDLKSTHESPWLTQKQAAKYIGCHTNYINKLVRQGALKAYVLNLGEGRKSGTKRYRRDELDACLKVL
jgi:excisionase family DNA binding protein